MTDPNGTIYFTRRHVFRSGVDSLNTMSLAVRSPPPCVMGGNGHAA